MGWVREEEGRGAEHKEGRKEENYVYTRMYMHSHICIHVINTITGSIHQIDVLL